MLIIFDVFVLMFLGCFVWFFNINIGFLNVGVFFWILLEFVSMRYDWFVKLWNLIVFNGLINLIWFFLDKYFLVIVFIFGLWCIG